MREVFGRLDEDGVVKDQGKDCWQWRADFVSDVLALIGLPRYELPEHEEDAPEDVLDSPVVDDGDDDVLGGDDGLREVNDSYAEWAAGRKAQNKPKRPYFQGARGKRRRTAAAQQIHVRPAQEERGQQNDERCTRRKANHFAWVMLIAGSSYHTLMMVLSFLGFWVPPQSTVHVRAQKGMIQLLHRLALVSCARWRAALRRDHVLGFDCAWSHNRRIHVYKHFV
jgi:hypothetical protein